MARDPSSIPGLARSTGEGKGYPLQYAGLENSMDYPVHGVSKQLSDFYFHFSFKLGPGDKEQIDFLFYCIHLHQFNLKTLFSHL